MLTMLTTHTTLTGNMPSASKRTHMLEEVVEYHTQQKRARFMRMVSELLDDLPSSDLSDADTSSSSTVSSPSSISLNSDTSSSDTHMGQSSSDFEDLDRLEDSLFQRWDAQIQVLAIRMLSVQVLEACPPVKKLGQLDLYLTNF